MIKEIENGILSIVVPVYNGEKCISQLLDSIIVSKSELFEIILIDDGSTDNTLNVCENYASQDCRIKVVHKENGGVSSARNCGLDYAQGEYVYFCDSDDYIFADVLNKAIYSIVTGADIIFFDYIYKNTDNCSTTKSCFLLNGREKLNKEYIITNVISPLVLKSGTDMAPLWHKFFKRRIIIDNNIRFEEGVHKGEDWRFILDFLSVAETAYYIPEVLYEYRLDGTQIESKYRVATGVSALGSVKRKLKLNEKFILGASDHQLLLWYGQQLNQVIASVKLKSSKREIYEMLRDSTVLESANNIWNSDDKLLISLEIPRKFKLYSLLIKLKFYPFFTYFCRLLG